MNPLDLYLQRVARELRELPPQTRDEEVRELRSHLEQRAEDFEGEGLSAEEAQTRAVLEFGSARSVGSKLCDAWEGLPFSAGRLGMALLAVTMIWFGANATLSWALVVLRYWDQSALFPELPYSFVAVVASVPFGCGLLLSQWLGRRGPLVTLIYFMGLFLLLASNRGLNFLTGDVYSFPLPIFNTAIALSGARLGQGLRKRRQHLAVVGGSTMAPTYSLSLTKRRIALVLCVGVVVGASIGARVYTALHPTTPTSILRASLLVNRGINPRNFEPPTILEMHELPAITPAERGGREKRVQFHLEARATRGYAKVRIAFLKKQLASAYARKSWREESLRSSLARLQRNRHQVEGIARLVRTPDGWQVDEKSFDRSQLWAWCDDILFENKT